MTGDDRIGAPLRASEVPSPVDSRLRAVFLQHRLVTAMPRLRGVPPAAAKFVLGQVVDRLLAVPGGLEPLMLLERHPDRLAAGTATAVVAVMLARAAGWPPGQLPDLGAAALLGELGPVLDDEQPGRAAFRWLVGRGVDDFWLRCALSARHLHAAPGDALPVGLPAVAVLQLATCVRRELAAAPTAAAWWPPVGQPLPAGLPHGLVELVPRVFATA